MLLQSIIEEITSPKELIINHQPLNPCWSTQYVNKELHIFEIDHPWRGLGIGLGV